MTQTAPPVDEIERHRHCDECNQKHEVIAFCTKCGACLYKHSKQIPDDKYPLFECTKCGQTNFWD